MARLYTLGKPTERTRRRRQLPIHSSLYHRCLGMRLTAVTLGLECDLGTRPSMLEQMGSQISSSTDGPTDPFLKNSRHLLIRIYDTDR